LFFSEIDAQPLMRMLDNNSVLRDKAFVFIACRVKLIIE